MARCELCKGTNRAMYVLGELRKSGEPVIVASNADVEFRPCPNLKEVVVDEITHERCQKCQGSGKGRRLIDLSTSQEVPCDYCGGSGVKHIITEKKMMIHESEVTPTPFKTE